MCWVAGQVFSWRHGAVAWRAGRSKYIEAQERKLGRRCAISTCEWTSSVGLFFCLIILAFSLSRLWRRTFCPVPVRCPRNDGMLPPLCPPPRPVPVMIRRSKEIIKEKTKEKEKLRPPILLPICGPLERRREEQRLFVTHGTYVTPRPPPSSPLLSLSRVILNRYKPPYARGG